MASRFHSQHAQVVPAAALRRRIRDVVFSLGLPESQPFSRGIFRAIGGTGTVNDTLYYSSVAYIQVQHHPAAHHSHFCKSGDDNRETAKHLTPTLKKADSSGIDQPRARIAR
jgi:hypothetical protein